MTGLLNCLKRGIGLTIIPRALVQPELDGGCLFELNWDMQAMETSILMIWHAEKWCSPLLKEFMGFAEKAFRFSNALDRKV